MRERAVGVLERLLFGRRPLVLALFAVVTLFMGYETAQLRIDAGFQKLLPLSHPFIQTFLHYGDEFGGANRLLIALRAKDGDIFTLDFFRRLKGLTDEVFFLPGVNRPTVQSLFTPNVRFIEIVEGGFAGGNVVPADFAGSGEQLALVRENVLKADIVGRLVANDFSAAMITAELLEIDPATGERLDYMDVAKRLEKMRVDFVDDQYDVHIIGFAKMIGDIADGAASVVSFFGIAIGTTAVLVYLFTPSLRLTLLPLFCALIAVVWGLGLFTLFGFGLDPMTILVPFLVFAIGVSHGVQVVSAVAADVARGVEATEAARAAFRRLVVPGAVAVVTSTIGFLTLLLIDIDMVQELALTAGLGVGVMILTSLSLLPVLLSYLRYPARLRHRLERAAAMREPFWRALGVITRPAYANTILAVSLVVVGLAAIEARNVKIGDLQPGVPELRPEARYNRDAHFITEHFKIGVDMITTIVETVADGCIQYDVMSEIDRFEWHMRNVPGVRSTVSMPQVVKVINAGWNEGSLKWRVLPRNSQTIVQSVSWIDTSSGLLNADCSAMPVIVFIEDHKADTIARVIGAVRAYATENDSSLHRFTLATGNGGVMAATNEVVAAAQVPIMGWVYAAVSLLCLASLRSVRGMLGVVLPLALVSVLCSALMSLLGIGLKVSTLPVAALGVGLGDDYGIYIFSRMKEELNRGADLSEAFLATLRVTGSAVLITGLTLATGVSTWYFSALQFQADMGLLLSFMLFANMLGALCLLPAIARILFPKRPRARGERSSRRLETRRGCRNVAGDEVAEESRAQASIALDTQGTTLHTPSRRRPALGSR
jgi:predicted RND superfamily exporter protein